MALIDYGSRQRVKIWGTARVVESDHELLTRLMPANYQARPEQVILFHVSAWDANCNQHIPLRFEAAGALKAIESRDARIKELEAELALPEWQAWSQEWSSGSESWPFRRSANRCGARGAAR